MENRAKSSASPSTVTLSTTDELHTNEAVSSQLGNGFNGSPEISIISSAAQAAVSGTGSSPGPGMDMIWSQWPQNLPGAELLKHLWVASVVSNDNIWLIASQRWCFFRISSPCSPSIPLFIVHGLSCTSPQSPSISFNTCLTRHMCCRGPIYSCRYQSPTDELYRDFSRYISNAWCRIHRIDQGAEEIFTQRHRLREDRPDTFAEMQAKFAKDAANELEYLGMDLLQVLQSTSIPYFRTRI